MGKAIAFVIVFATLLGCGVWYRAHVRIQASVEQQKRGAMKDGVRRVDPNPELVQIFTDLDEEWSRTATANKPVNGANATGTQTGRTR